MKASLYAKSVIDETNELSIGETYNDACKLMRCIRTYLQGGDIKRCEVIMECLDDQEALRDIVKKIKK